MATANTFGTFLDTFKQLESGPDQASDLTKSILILASTLASTGGSLPVKTAVAESGLPKDEFFNVMGAGIDKKVFAVNEHAEEPVLTLTGLGRSLL